MSVTPEEREMFAWIAASTPLGAVVMEGNVVSTGCRSTASAGAFFPTRPRSPFSATTRTGESGGLREIRDGIFSEAPLREDDMTVLDAMKPDLYVVVWREDMRAVPRHRRED